MNLPDVSRNPSVLFHVIEGNTGQHQVRQPRSLGTAAETIRAGDKPQPGVCQCLVSQMPNGKYQGESHALISALRRWALAQDPHPEQQQQQEISPHPKRRLNLEELAALFPVNVKEEC